MVFIGKFGSALAVNSDASLSHSNRPLKQHKVAAQRQLCCCSLVGAVAQCNPAGKADQTGTWQCLGECVLNADRPVPLAWMCSTRSHTAGLMFFKQHTHMHIVQVCKSTANSLIFTTTLCCAHTHLFIQNVCFVNAVQVVLPVASDIYGEQQLAGDTGDLLWPHALERLDGRQWDIIVLRNTIKEQMLCSRRELSDRCRNAFKECTASRCEKEPTMQYANCSAVAEPPQAGVHSSSTRHSSRWALQNDSTSPATARVPWQWQDGCYEHCKQVCVASIGTCSTLLAVARR